MRCDHLLGRHRHDCHRHDCHRTHGSRRRLPSLHDCRRRALCRRRPPPRRSPRAGCGGRAGGPAAGGAPCIASVSTPLPPFPSAAPALSLARAAAETVSRRVTRRAAAPHARGAPTSDGAAPDCVVAAAADAASAAAGAAELQQPSLLPDSPCHQSSSLWRRSPHCPDGLVATSPRCTPGHGDDQEKPLPTGCSRRYCIDSWYGSGSRGGRRGRRGASCVRAAAPRGAATRSPPPSTRQSQPRHLIRASQGR